MFLIKGMDEIKKESNTCTPFTKINKSFFSVAYSLQILFLTSLLRTFIFIHSVFQRMSCKYGGQSIFFFFESSRFPFKFSLSLSKPLHENASLETGFPSLLLGWPISNSLIKWGIGAHTPWWINACISKKNRITQKTFLITKIRLMNSVHRCETRHKHIEWIR